MSVHDRYKTFQADQREFFDTLITEDWSTYASKDWDATRRFEVSQLFARIQPKTILDIGCGCGFHDLEMAQYPFVEQVEAIDYSPKSIERANMEYPHPKVARRTADFGHFQTNKTYELVTSFQVFEHLDKPEAYLQSCRKVCSENGRIAIFTPNRRRLRNVLRGLRGLPPELCDPQHFKEYTASEISNLGLDFGFRLDFWFGTGLDGFRWLSSQPMKLRLRLGATIPWFASGICVVMKRDTA
jgi:2-polyprenyl-3-methyl-5-hydroxy-6-metoxy-1,4-benzoquinol methylase